MTDTFSIFVDARPVTATRGQSVMDAIAASSPEVAGVLRAGERILTDSRGLPTDAAAPAYAGAIFRVVSSRAARVVTEDGIEDGVDG